MIPEFCIEHLLTITEADKGRLYACGVDRFKVEEQLVDCIGKVERCNDMIKFYVVFCR